MRITFVRLAALCGAFACTPLPGRAQAQDPDLPVWNISIEGSSSSLSGYVAELFDSHHQRFGLADVATNNTFEFRHVPFGDYSVVVMDSTGGVAYQGLVSANRGMWQTAIRLPEGASRQLPGGPVSVQELLHPPSSKAVRSFASAQKFTQSGDYQKAAGELEKAIKFSPEFAAAYTNLAAQYNRLGRFQEAEAASRRAIELGKPNSKDLCNMAFSQASQRRFDEAMKTAQACYDMGPDLPQANYLMGCLLARDRRTLPQALRYLELAAPSLPGIRPQLEAVRRALSQVTEAKLQ